MKTEFYKQFNSGLRLVMKKMTGIYTVSFGVMVGTGSRNETPEVNGYSHFIEHLQFKGTDKRTALQISEEIDAIGGQINAYTSKDLTCYYTRTATEYLGQCFDILSDMYFNAKFDKKEIDMEKNVILEEISMDEDVPEDVCHELLAKSVYKDDPLAQPIVGTKENIKDSSRESLLKYKSKYYVPHNTVISIAGNVEFVEVCELIEKYFESYFTKEQKSIIVPKVSVPTFHSDFLYKFKDAEQSHIALAYPSYELGSEKGFAAAVMSNIFGGGMSSRLFQKIREQNGLAYSVYSYLSNYKNTGYFEIYCGTNPTNIPRLIPLLQEEITRFFEGFSDKEFEIGKAQLVGSTLLAQESSMTIMNAYGSYMLKIDKMFDMNKRMKDIKGVTKEQVMDAIEDIFHKSPASTYVGKKADNYSAITQIK